MIRPFLTAILLGAMAPVVASAQVLPQARAVSNSVATIQLTPSGATLKPGDTLTFAAQAFNKQGQPIAARFTWSSVPTTVLSLSASGAATARAQGFATVTAHAGGKSARTLVTVVPATGQAYTAVTGAVQINGIVADETSVYWTETDSRVTRVRKTPKAGGPIYDLLTQPAHDSRGVSEAFVHLRQMDDRLYVSRQALGLLEHWSIYEVPKAGGPATQILAEDISTQTMSASGWNLCGKYVVVALRAAQKLNLPPNTLAAAYDTEARVWSPVIHGGFQAARYYIAAADDHYFYFRGVSDQSDTRVLRVDPSAAVNSYTTLQTYLEIDSDLSQSGTSDGQNLFVWSNRGGLDKILCYPISGGNPVTVYAGTAGTGLTTDGSSLYWAKSQTSLLRLPNSGGSSLAVLAQGLLPASTSGPIAIDATSAYVARAVTTRNDAIVPVTR